jgi:hypothetical protein
MGLISVMTERRQDTTLDLLQRHGTIIPDRAKFAQTEDLERVFMASVRLLTTQYLAEKCSREEFGEDVFKNRPMDAMTTVANIIKALDNGFSLSEIGTPAMCLFSMLKRKPENEFDLTDSDSSK